MQQFLKSFDSDEICVLLCGWGTDEKPFLPVADDMNYLMLFDYRSLDFSFDFSSYKKKYLLAFSAGVAVCGLRPDLFTFFDYKVAINGAFKLFDNHYGSPESVIKVFRSLNLNNYMDFRKNYLTASDEEFEKFNANSPKVSFKNSFEELSALENYYKDNNDIHFKFDRVFTSKNDKIIPPENQINTFGNVSLTDGGHFPFYRHDSVSYFLH